VSYILSFQLFPLLLLGIFSGHLHIHLPPSSIQSEQLIAPHFRKRVHPGSLEYYRGDYKDYFLTTQIVVGFDGQLWSVHIGLGHNNDMNMFQLSRVGHLLMEGNVHLLADRGYISQTNLVSPREMPDEDRNATHKRLRAIVERVFGFAKNWRALSERFPLSPEMQRICLFSVYQIVAKILNDFPLMQNNSQA